MRSTVNTSRSINNTNSGSTGVASNYLSIDDYNQLEQPQTVIDNTLIAKFPIKTIDIMDYNITNTKMALNSVGTNNLIDNCISDSKIININGSKIFDNSIDGSKIINDSISNNKIISIPFSKITSVLVNNSHIGENTI